jgi:ribonuclease-3
LTEIDSLQETLGVSFEDIAYLQQSLIHRSYLNEIPDSSLESNERLEFLGDALLGLVVAGELYHRFPDLPEGNLTRLRSALVRTDTLARVARSLNLGDCLYMGKGEEETGGRNRQRNLACALEAVTGAVFIDRGFEVAREFVLRVLASEFEPVISGKLGRDPKSKLQEIVQAQKQQLPVYQVVDSTGPDHEKIFTIEVLVDGILLGHGTGKSKRGAEQEAARVALERLEGENLV